MHSEAGKRRIVLYGIILLSVFILCLSLYSDGLTGLSDNADFGRVMAPNRISYAEGQRNPFVFENRFKMSFKGGSRAEKLYNMLFTLDEPYYTTHNIFIKLSMLANLAFNFVTGSDLGSYNIFWLGLVYSVFYIGAIAVLAGHIKTGRLWLDALIGSLLAFMFCDAGYVEYFNSFYGEPVQLVALMWVAASVAGVISSRRGKIWYAVLFYISVAVFSGAKFANVPIGVLLSVCGLFFLLYFKDGKGWRGRRIVLTGCFIAAVSCCVFFYLHVPEWMEDDTTYQSVFYGVLKGSPAPEEDLARLGLPREYARLADTHAYMSDYKLDVESEQFKKTFYGGVSKADVLQFYLKNPARFMEKIEVSLLNSAHIRPSYLGSYNAGHERLKFRDSVTAWSGLRLRLPLDSLPFTVILFGVSILLILCEFAEMAGKSFKAGTEGNAKVDNLVVTVFFTALNIINAMNLAIPVIANGEADLQKHMFAYVMGMDMQLLFLAFWIVWKLLERAPGRAPVLKNGIRSMIPTLLAAVVLVVSSVVLSVSEAIPVRRTIEIKPGSNTGAVVHIGDYVRLGTGAYPGRISGEIKKSGAQSVQTGGEPLLWRIINADGSRLQLLAAKPVAYRAFDGSDADFEAEDHKKGKAKEASADANREKYGSNFWPDSDIRKWLNGEFLNAFTPRELELIEAHQNWLILSEADKGKARRGDNDFFWTHVPSRADYGAGRAYAMSVTDRVFLPDVSEFTEDIVKNRLESRPRESYWLETPYFLNSSMVRVVGKDGYVYMKDADFDEIGIRPSLFIDINLEGLEITGSGRRDDPFTFRIQ